MESQLLTSSLLRRNSSAPLARINMSAHSAGSENGIKIRWVAACLESGPSSKPVTRPWEKFGYRKKILAGNPEPEQGFVISSLAVCVIHIVYAICGIKPL